MTIEEQIRVLTEEVTTLASRLKPSGTEYITNEIRAKTKLNLDTLAAIDVINGRIAELKLEAAEEMSVSEQMQEELEPLPSSYDYGEEQARLRRIQDSAAGRKPNAVRDAYLHSSRQKDDYEHTDEYYDTERNRSPNIQTMTSDASVTISPPTKNFISMKQKYGHAVLTVSEMMEEELDPLPINTFE